MQKFSFKTKKDMIMFENGTYKPFKDKNGNPLSGDELLKQMAVIATEWEKKYGQPVPIPEQNFVAWLKQGKAELDKGMSSEEYFRKTLIRSMVI